MDGYLDGSADPAARGTAALGAGGAGFADETHAHVHARRARERAAGLALQEKVDQDASKIAWQIETRGLQARVLPLRNERIALDARAGTVEMPARGVDGTGDTGVDPFARIASDEMRAAVRVDRGVSYCQRTLESLVAQRPALASAAELVGIMQTQGMRFSFAVNLPSGSATQARRVELQFAIDHGVDNIDDDEDVGAYARASAGAQTAEGRAHEILTGAPLGGNSVPGTVSVAQSYNLGGDAGSAWMVQSAEERERMNINELDSFLTDALVVHMQCTLVPPYPKLLTDISLPWHELHAFMALPELFEHVSPRHIALYRINPATVPRAGGTPLGVRLDSFHFSLLDV